MAPFQGAKAEAPAAFGRPKGAGFGNPGQRPGFNDVHIVLFALKGQNMGPFPGRTSCRPWRSIG